MFRLYLYANTCKAYIVQTYLLNLTLFVYVYAVYPSVEPGWLQATYDGKTGLVPENYVEYL